jgi:hypothetical protein
MEAFPAHLTNYCDSGENWQLSCYGGVVTNKEAPSRARGQAKLKVGEILSWPKTTNN